jgi:hypothetical protein
LYVTDMIDDGRGDELSRMSDDCICLSAKGNISEEK